jgi:hypothetical protein
MNPYVNKEKTEEISIEYVFYMKESHRRKYRNLREEIKN